MGIPLDELLELMRERDSVMKTHHSEV
jgi:hypothetical protein